MAARCGRRCAPPAPPMPECREDELVEVSRGAAVEHEGVEVLSRDLARSMACSMRRTASSCRRLPYRACNSAVVGIPAGLAHQLEDDPARWRVEGAGDAAEDEQEVRAQNAWNRAGAGRSRPWCCPGPQSRVRARSATGGTAPPCGSGPGRRCFPSRPCAGPRQRSRRGLRRTRRRAGPRHGGAGDRRTWPEGNTAVNGDVP